MPKKGTLAGAAAEIRALQATGAEIIPAAVEKAIWHVDQSLPPAERLKAEALAQEAAGGGYERVVALSREIVEAGLSFADINPGDAEPPKAWVERWGAQGAMRRLRMAQAAWLPSRDAPAAMSIATDVLKMDARVKASAKTAPPQLNIAIQLNMAPREYPEIIEGEDE